MEDPSANDEGDSIGCCLPRFVTALRGTAALPTKRLPYHHGMEATPPRNGSRPGDRYSRMQRNLPPIASFWALLLLTAREYQ